MYKGARRSGRVLRGTAQVGMGLRNPLWRTVPSLGKLSFTVLCCPPPAHCSQRSAVSPPYAQGGLPAPFPPLSLAGCRISYECWLNTLQSGEAGRKGVGG